MERTYRFLAMVAKAILRLMGWHVQVEGPGAVPGTGPAVLAANHVSYLDPILLAWPAERLGRPVRFLAKSELFTRRGFGWLLRWARQIPVDRQGKANAALTGGLAALERGELVGMFPEATISRSFVLQDPKTGAARMAVGAGVPLIPVALWGGQRIATKGRRPRLRRGMVLSVRIGTPVPYEAGEDAGAVAARLVATLSDLVDEAAVGYPQSPAGPHDDWWLPHHLGGSAPTPQRAAEEHRREVERKRALRTQREGPGRSRGLDEGDRR